LRTKQKARSGVTTPWAQYNVHIGISDILLAIVTTSLTVKIDSLA